MNVGFIGLFPPKILSRTARLTILYSDLVCFVNDFFPRFHISPVPGGVMVVWALFSRV
jgi:hypothetical protein